MNGVTCGGGLVGSAAKSLLHACYSIWGRRGTLLHALLVCPRGRRGGWQSLQHCRFLWFLGAPVGECLSYSTKRW